VRTFTVTCCAVATRLSGTVAVTAPLAALTVVASGISEVPATQITTGAAQP
jgi:hypothetical protein